MTLEIQKYLREPGNTPESLVSRGIYCYRHPSLPLIGFKYDQIEAPRQDPIVREARGIVLEDSTFNVVAKSFNRFFNLGEFPEELEHFNWANFTVTTKEDGSLILLYFYAGEWRVNTSGSFGLGEVNRSDKTWGALFWATATANGFRSDKLNTKLTYVLELCTPYNKVVRRYEKPSIFLLSIFHPADNCFEMDHMSVDSWADILHVKRPRRWLLDSKEALLRELDVISATDPSFEGFVICDNHRRRWKCKTATYAALHGMKDNGNIILPKNLVRISLKGDCEEVKAIMPEISTALDLVDKEVKAEFAILEALWEANKAAVVQKDFAMAVKDNKFAGVLFAARKTSLPIKDIWRKDPEAIADKLFGKRTFEFDILEG